MEVLLPFGKAFAVGGLLCLIGQLLIDYTKLTPARILTSYVVAGVILGALGIYGPFAEWAGAGATVSGAGGASDAGAAVCGASVDPSLYGTYRLAPNAAGFTGLSIDDTALRIDAEQTSYSFLYGRNTPVRSVDPLCGQPLFGQAYPQLDGSLYLYIQIVGDYVGSLHFLLRASDSCLTLSIRRFEETLFPSFDGFFEGTRA